MRGPILSGPLGSASSLEAILRHLEGARTVAVIGPLWLGEALSDRVPVLLLVEPEERDRARRVARRAAKAGRRLSIAVAGVELPLGAGTLDALLIESPSTLDPEAVARWMAALVPTLRQGGRLLAADVTDNPAVESRLAGLFLQAALMGITQDRPRDGVVLTVGLAPPPVVVARRFAALTG
jgi:hypothetical protein